MRFTLGIAVLESHLWIKHICLEIIRGCPRGVVVGSITNCIAYQRPPKNSSGVAWTLLFPNEGWYAIKHQTKLLAVVYLFNGILTP